MILEDQFNQAESELREKKAQLKEVRPATAEVKRDQHTMKTKENQLDQNLKHFNQLQAENKTLRQQIDVMRKEMKNQIYENVDT